MADSVKTFQAHLTAVMDSLVRASVCEITKLFQDTVNDYLVEISLNRKENEALKLRLRLTENKLRNERKYGMAWATNRRAAGLLAADETGVKKRKVDTSKIFSDLLSPVSVARFSLSCFAFSNGDPLLSFFSSLLPLSSHSLPPSPS